MSFGRVIKDRKKYGLAFILSALVIVGLFFVFQPLLAQDNLDTLRNASGASDVGLVTFIGNIIRVILGLLGVVAVVLLIYAGFIWMTASGDPAKVIKAQKIITGAIIGLIIIFASFAIASFVISRLGGPQNPPPEPCDTADPGSCSIGICDGERYCINGYWGPCHKTQPSCPDDPYFGRQFSYISGFSDPTFPLWTRFRNLSRNFSGTVQLPLSGSTIVSGYAHDKNTEISRLELNPESASTIIFDNSASVIKTVNGQPYNVVEGASTTWSTAAYAANATTSIFIKVFNVATLGENTFNSRKLIIRFWPAHCFNGVKDEGESDVDCGGSCPNCDGASCRRPGESVCSDNNCASGICLTANCTCASNPKIDYISPASDTLGNTDFAVPSTTLDDIANGAAGNFVTIWGRGFGTAPGQVIFRSAGDSLYFAPLYLSPNCSGTWSNNQIITKVPEELASQLGNYNVEVVNSSTNLTSNQKLFEVNNINRPGICTMLPPSGVHPSTTQIYGNKFPTIPPQAVLWQVYNRYYQVSGGYVISSTAVREEMTSTYAIDWTAFSVTDTPPQNKRGRSGVRVYNGAEYSNYFNFLISAGSVGEPCGYSSTACNEDVDTCNTSLACQYCQSVDPASANYDAHCDYNKNCTCQPPAGTCLPGAVSTTPTGQPVTCTPDPLIANCSGWLTCNYNGTGYGCVADPSDTDCPNYLPGNAAQSIYSYAFTAVRNGGEGDSCGYDGWGECDINGCDKGFVCNINGGGERQWIELYNPTSHEINYSEYSIAVYDSSSNSTTTYNLTNTSSKFFVFEQSLPARGRIVLKKGGTQEDIIEYGNNILHGAVDIKSYGRPIDGTSSPFIVLNQASRQSANSSSPAYFDAAAATGRAVINEVYIGTPPCTCTLGQPCKAGQVDNKVCPPLGVCPQIKVCDASGYWGSCVLADPNCLPYPPTGNAAQSIFAWAFIANLANGIDEPYVIESCNRDTDCIGQPLGSPSPWFEGYGYTENDVPVGWTSTTNPYVLHEKACLDSVITARFNVKMFADSFADKIKVLECSDREGTGCSEVPPADYSWAIENDNNSIDDDILTIIPKTNLNSDKWYKVILLKGIVSDFNKPLKVELDKISWRYCSAGGINANDIAYCWNFQTRNDPAVDGQLLCNIGCVECQPNPSTAWWYLYQTAHRATPVADDNVCIALDAGRYAWDWLEKEYDKDPSDPTADDIKDDANWVINTVSPYAEALATNISYTTSTALGETIFNNPNFVRIAATERESQKMGYCKLKIDFTNPIVMEDRACHSGTTQSPSPYKGTTDACINAMISARFSRNMRNASIFSNTDQNNYIGTASETIIIQRCNGESAVTSTALNAGGNCTDVPVTNGFIFPYTHNDMTLEQMVAASSVTSSDPEGFVINPLDGNGTPGHTLLKDTWYRVIIRGGEEGVRGTTGTNETAYGVLMTPGLTFDFNFSDAGDLNGDGDADYLWYFKTDNTDQLCPVDTVNVSPWLKFFRFVKENSPYNAFPQAANCNILDGEAYTWAWRSLIDLGDDKVDDDKSGGSGAGIAKICTTSTIGYLSCSTSTRSMVKVFGANEGFVNIKARALSTRKIGADWNDPQFGDKWGYGKLQIGYGDLSVTSHYPLSTVCKNPDIGVGFSMDAVVSTFSLNNNVKLYSCDEGLAYYPLNGTSTDMSGHGYNGTASSSQYGGGKFGSAMQFDGQSVRYVEVTNPALHITQDMTVSAWVKLNAQSAEGRIIVSSYSYNTGGNTSRGWYLGNDWSLNDDMKFGVIDSNGSGATAGINGFLARYGDDFVQVTGVFKAGQYVKLFINGREVASKLTTIANIAYTPGIPTRIGQRADGYDQGKWDGLIDEVRIYNRALTANDVKKLYESTADGCPFVSTALNLEYNPAPTAVYAKHFFMTSTSALAPGSNYRMVVKGGSSGVKAWNGKPLANYDLIFKVSSTAAGGEQCESSTYPWSTVLVNDSNVCSSCLLNPAINLCGTLYSQCTTSTAGTAYCDGNCQNLGNRNIASCGDGILGPAEECDDGNIASNDGCSNSCLLEGSSDAWRPPSLCGNGRIETGEACDDGNIDNNDTCSSNCLKKENGSGGAIIHPAGSVTSSPICGNNIIEPGEDCDDGNIESNDGCKGTESGQNGCILEGSKHGAVCGDGIVETGQYDSFSWAFTAGDQICTPAEIIWNPCPNGIWRFKLSKEIVSSTIIVYKQMESASAPFGAASCQSLALKAKPANFFVAALNKIKDVVLRLLGVRKASAALQWCPISEVKFTDTDFSNMRKGFLDKTVPSIYTDGATSNNMEVIGYTDESDSYLINYHNNADWSARGTYRAKVITDDGSGAPRTVEDSIEMYSAACEIKKITADIWPRGQTKEDDAFFCSGDLCGRATSDNDLTTHSDEYDDDMSAEWTQTNSSYDLKETATAYKDGNQHLYRLWARGDYDYLLKATTTQQVRDLDGINVTSAELKVNNATTAYSGDYWITGGNKNGEAALLVTSTGARGEKVTAVINIWTFLCNNPWPAPPYFPFRDNRTDNCLGGTGTCFNTNFITYYCRDAGDISTAADDLPALPTTTSPTAAVKVLVKGGNTAFGDCPNLSANFVPVLGYIDLLTGNNQLNLWSTNNDHNIRNKDGVWELVASGAEASRGLPSNFKPIIGYYHNFNVGRVNLWDASGRLYVGKKVDNNILWYAGNDSRHGTPNSGLPSGFVPGVGYFDGASIYLWSGRNLYKGTWDGSKINYSPVTISNLPTNYYPIIGYKNNGQGRQEIWNSAGVRYVSTNNGASWSINAPTGLPASFHPKVGYYDDGNKVVLWDGQNAYSSTGGTAFTAENYFNATCDINIKEFYFSTSTAAGGNIGLGIKVVSNNNHYSPLYWYQTRFAKGRQGNPKAIESSGYQGIMEGRTAYLNAVNVQSNLIYTNMYVMSYDQDVGTEGNDIFNQMVKYWEFNRGIAAADVYGVCTDGSSIINPNYYCADDESCLRFTSSTQYFCSSDRSKVARDARRLADIQDINVLLRKYYNQGRCSTDLSRLCSDSNQCYGGGVCGRFYPALRSGTYIIGKSFSIWPSWLSNLGNSLGAALPADPINKFFGCSWVAGAATNSITCWNEQDKRMQCPLIDASVYQYTSQGTTSNFLIKSEYDATKGTKWQPDWKRVDFLRFSPFFHYSTSSMCSPLPACGNGFCDAGETAASCRGDCPPTAGGFETSDSCGNGIKETEKGEQCDQGAFCDSHCLCFPNSHSTGVGCACNTGYHTGSNGCISDCPVGWAGLRCDQCADHFICTGGTPRCITGWTGIYCDVCDPNYVCPPGGGNPYCEPGRIGPTCDDCDPHYDCGGGTPVCLPGWTGPTCDVCDPHYDCGGGTPVCLPGWTGPSCDDCDPNYDCSGGTPTCEPGRTGPTCTDCDPNYVCPPGGGTPYCELGRTGPTCDDCDPNYYCNIDTPVNCTGVGWGTCNYTWSACSACSQHTTGGSRSRTGPNPACNADGSFDFLRGTPAACPPQTQACNDVGSCCAGETAYTEDACPITDNLSVCLQSGSYLSAVGTPSCIWPSPTLSGYGQDWQPDCWCYAKNTNEACIGPICPGCWIVDHGESGNTGAFGCKKHYWTWCSSNQGKTSGYNMINVNRASCSGWEKWYLDIVGGSGNLTIGSVVKLNSPGLGNLKQGVNGKVAEYEWPDFANGSELQFVVCKQGGDCSSGAAVTNNTLIYLAYPSDTTLVLGTDTSHWRSIQWQKYPAGVLIMTIKAQQ